MRAALAVSPRGFRQAARKARLICAFRRSRTAFRDAPEQANKLAQALMLCFLLRRFSSLFAMGCGNLSAGHPTLAASTKSVFDGARNAVRLAPEYALIHELECFGGRNEC
jgi:hypothetical protein